LYCSCVVVVVAFVAVVAAVLLLVLVQRFFADINTQLLLFVVHSTGMREQFKRLANVQVDYRPLHRHELHSSYTGLYTLILGIQKCIHVF